MTSTRVGKGGADRGRTEGAPRDPMAGLGMDLLAFGLGLFVLVALVMGAIVSRIDSARQVASTGEEPTADVVR